MPVFRRRKSHFRALCPIPPHPGVILAWLVVTALTFAADVRADRLILRDLTIISSCTVAAFDEDGVRLSDDRVITWDKIERATVAPDQQENFDRLLGEIGTALFRIRKRLEVGDYQGLLPYAEAMYPRYKQRRSRTAYMVCQSLMWSRIAAGQREAAVEPYLRSYEYLRATRDLAKDNLPGQRTLAFDGKTALTTSLQPVWFDPDAAKAALAGVAEAVRDMAQPHPEGVFVYSATLALAAGETDQGLELLQAISGQIPTTAQLRDIALAQSEVLNKQPGQAVARLESSLSLLVPQNRPVAIYWLGMAKLAETDDNQRRAGVLELLHVPAVYGGKYDELAGASLYNCMSVLDEMKDTKASLALREELLARYPQTVHAARVRNAPALTAPK